MRACALRTFSRPWQQPTTTLWRAGPGTGCRSSWHLLPPGRAARTARALQPGEQPREQPRQPRTAKTRRRRGQRTAARRGPQGSAAVWWRPASCLAVPGGRVCASGWPCWRGSRARAACTNGRQYRQAGTGSHLMSVPQPSGAAHAASMHRTACTALQASRMAAPTFALTVHSPLHPALVTCSARWPCS